MERTQSRFIEDTGEFTGKTMDPDQTGSRSNSSNGKGRAVYNIVLG
jgi:hypothetical protein